jgi:hypothetical protein
MPLRLRPRAEVITSSDYKRVFRTETIVTLKRRSCLACLGALILFPVLRAADPPQAEIANSQIRAKLYLPDPVNGYYQATRFDWSGQISSLTYKGHEYYGQWFEKWDPKKHDSIMGPVQEYVTPLGYEKAADR